MEKDIVCVKKKLLVNPLKIPEIRIIWTIMVAMILGFGILVAILEEKSRKLSIYRKYTSGKILFSEIDGDVIQIGRKIESLFNQLIVLIIVYVILSTFICAYLSAVFKQEPILVMIAFPIFAPIYALILYMFVLTDPLQCFQILDKGIRILHIYTEKRFISKSDIEKFTLNTKKKRIEIQLKNGEKIVLRRGRREMKERFSEIRINELQNALRKLGVSYEIV